MAHGVRPGRVAAAALLGLLAACARGGDRSACAWPPFPDTAGWPVADAGLFVLKVPPALREEVATGTTGYIGLWAGENRALAFDYGPTAADPRGRPTGGEEWWSCETPIGGRAAVVRVGVRSVQARPGTWQRHAVAEAWWRGAGPDSARLLVIGWGAEADSAVVIRDALAAARTVRFRTVWTPADSVRQLHRFCRTLRVQAERREEYRGAWEEWRPRCPTGPAPPPPAYERVR